MKTPTSEQLPAIATMLAKIGLPIDDLEAQDLSLFRIKTSPDGLDAVGGLERCGDTALIRSVATADSKRGHGLAGDIVEALEKLAASKGIDSLYLLTESAELYFASKGYSPVERSTAPTPIQNSRQFSSLCPHTATVMYKCVSS